MRNMVRSAQRVATTDICRRFASVRSAFVGDSVPLDSDPLTHYEEGELVDKSACAQVRADLKKCLLESDCCRIKKKTPRECLKDPEGLVPSECFALRISFFECKRSMIDMRARFRGRKGE